MGCEMNPVTMWLLAITLAVACAAAADDLEDVRAKLEKHVGGSWQVQTYHGCSKIISKDFPPPISTGRYQVFFDFEETSSLELACRFQYSCSAAFRILGRNSRCTVMTVSSRNDPASRCIVRALDLKEPKANGEYVPIWKWDEAYFKRQRTIIRWLRPALFFALMFASAVYFYGFPRKHGGAFLATYATGLLAFVLEFEIFRGRFGWPLRQHLTWIYLALALLHMAEHLIRSCGATELRIGRRSMSHALGGLR